MNSDWLNTVMTSQGLEKDLNLFFYIFFYKKGWVFKRTQSVKIIFWKACSRDLHSKHILQHFWDKNAVSFFFLVLIVLHSFFFNMKQNWRQICTIKILIWLESRKPSQVCKSRAASMTVRLNFPSKKLLAFSVLVKVSAHRVQSCKDSLKCRTKTNKQRWGNQRLPDALPWDPSCLLPSTLQAQVM